MPDVRSAKALLTFIRRVCVSKVVGFGEKLAAPGVAGPAGRGWATPPPGSFKQTNGRRRRGGGGHAGEHKRRSVTRQHVSVPVLYTLTGGQCYIWTGFSFSFFFFFFFSNQNHLFSFPVPLNFRTLCSKLKIVQTLQEKCVKNSVCLTDWPSVCLSASHLYISTHLSVWSSGLLWHTGCYKRRTPCRMEGKSLCHKTSSVKACFHPGFTAVVETLVQSDICWCRLPGWGRAQHHQSVFYEHEVNIFSVLNTIIKGFNINSVFWLLISPRHTLCRLFLLSEVITIIQYNTIQ